MTRTARIELSADAREVIVSEAAKRLPASAEGTMFGHREGSVVVVTDAHVAERGGRLSGRRRDAASTAEAAEYVGQWHSRAGHTAVSAAEIDKLLAGTNTDDSPLAIVVHSPASAEPFRGLIVRRRLGRVTRKNASVDTPQPTYPLLGPLPDGAVRRDGPVFISYRQSDGTGHADSLANILRAAGLVVWRDRDDLRPGTITDRLEQALTEGLSAAVLVVTPEIVHSEVVRERELPRLLQLDDDPAFGLCIANAVAAADGDSACDYGAPDRLLRLLPARPLAAKKQSNLVDPSGEKEVVRDLLMHRVAQIKPAFRAEGRAFTIRLQSRPVPSAIDARDDDLHIRVMASADGRLPSPEGLRLLKTTLPLVSDAAHATGAATVRVCGGGHLSIALAVGAALPETKIGTVEVEVSGAMWESRQSVDDPHVSELYAEKVHVEPRSTDGSMARVAVFLSLTPNADRTAFTRLLDDGFTTAVALTLRGVDRIDPRESGRLSAQIVHQIKRLAAGSGRAEVHLAFHGPFPMGVLIGRHLNTLRTVVYEWSNDATTGPSYTRALVLEPGVAGGPIVSVLA